MAFGLDTDSFLNAFYRMVNRRGLPREMLSVTADYSKAIQDERRMLIKAMFKAKEQGSEAKVVGRYLYIGELKYDVTNIPEDFK